MQAHWQIVISLSSMKAGAGSKGMTQRPCLPAAQMKPFGKWSKIVIPHTRGCLTRLLWDCCCLFCTGTQPTGQLLLRLSDMPSLPCHLTVNSTFHATLIGTWLVGVEMNFKAMSFDFCMHCLQLSSLAGKEKMARAIVTWKLIQLQSYTFFGLRCW